MDEPFTCISLLGSSTLTGTTDTLVLTFVPTATGCNLPANQAVYIYSHDDGLTWSAPSPVDVSPTVGQNATAIGLPGIATDGLGSWVSIALRWLDSGRILMANGMSPLPPSLIFVFVVLIVQAWEPKLATRSLPPVSLFVKLI